MLGLDKMTEPFFMPKSKRFGRRPEHFNELRKRSHKKSMQAKLFNPESDNIQDNAWLFTQI